MITLELLQMRINLYLQKNKYMIEGLLKSGLHRLKRNIVICLWISMTVGGIGIVSNAAEIVDGINLTTAAAISNDAV